MRHPQRGCESGSTATALQSSRKTRAGSLLELRFLLFLPDEKLFMIQLTGGLEAEPELEVDSAIAGHTHPAATAASAKSGHG